MIGVCHFGRHLEKYCSYYIPLDINGIPDNKNILFDVLHDTFGWKTAIWWHIWNIHVTDVGHLGSHLEKYCFYYISVDINRILSHKNILFDVLYVIFGGQIEIWWQIWNIRFRCRPSWRPSWKILVLLYFFGNKWNPWQQKHTFCCITWHICLKNKDFMTHLKYA